MFRKIFWLTSLSCISLFIIPSTFSMDRMDVDSNDIIDELSHEQKSLKDSGAATFAAARSNFKKMPDKPEIFISEMAKIKPGILKDDTIVADGLISELTENHLLPDYKTFYLLWFGLPHLPALQNALLSLDIDPSIYVDPTVEEINDRLRKGMYERYIAVYKYFWEQLSKKRLQLAEKQPKGFALLVNSHMSNSEGNRLKTILPSISHLKKLNIKKVVFGIERYFQHGTPSPSNPTFKSFFSASPIHAYIKQLYDNGFTVSVIGFDYRYKEREQSETSFNFFEDEPFARYERPKLIYRPSQVENHDFMITQSMQGYTIAFDKKTGEISAVNENGFRRTPNQAEIKEFINNIYAANIALTNNEKLSLEKYMTKK